jgi:hypothetical protein
MSKKRIDIIEQTNLKELYQFVGVANYFRDHIADHSIIVRPLQEMIDISRKQKTKGIDWTPEGHDSFKLIKERINLCPKLYYINDSYPIELCTDASDYAIGAYLYQICPDQQQQPIRFLSKTLQGAQRRWSTIEKEAFSIYYTIHKMEDLLGS